MLTFKISGDAVLPAADLGNLGAIWSYLPPAMVVIVMFVLLPLENRASHKIRGVTALLETPLVIYK